MVVDEAYFEFVDRPDYPDALRHRHDAPLVLYTLGDRRLLGQKQIAVVGSRHASRDGLAHARELQGHLSWLESFSGTALAVLATASGIYTYLGVSSLLDDTGALSFFAASGSSGCMPSAQPSLM